MRITPPTATMPQNRFYFKNGLWLYALTMLVYSPFIFFFMWGNHDWQWVKEYTPLASGIFEGRFSQFILPTLLFEGNILPILTLSTAFAFFSAAAILLFRLWNLPQKSSIYLLLGLNLTCSPYTLSWLYFAFITLSIFSWVFVVVLAYYLLAHRQISSHPACLFITASLLFMLALGGYPPVINLIGIIFWTLVLNGISLKSLTPKSAFRKYFPYAASICLAIVGFIIIQFLLKKYHLQDGTYNTASISFNELAAKLRFSLASAVKQFFTTTSFISYSYKYFGLCLFLLALLRLWNQLPKSFLSILSFAVSIVGLLLSSVIALFAAENTLYVLFAPRIEFFSLIYIYIFSAAVLFKSSTPLIRNTTAAVLACLLLYNANTATYAQKTWRFGWTAENAFAERFISRLEDNPAFDPQKAYTFVQSGTLDFRSRYYLSNSAGNPDSYTLTAPYIPWHLPSKAYKFYYPEDFFQADFDVFWSFVEINQLSLTSPLADYLAQRSAPWPSPAALYLDAETIILTLTPDGQNRARIWVKNNADLSS